MKPSRRITTLASSACALALVCAAVSASAQEVFKQVDEEGHTTFSDKPPPRKSVVLPRRGGKVDVSEAARRLEMAQLARKQGVEPKSGEFKQISGVRTVNYRYWQRQEKLRVAVEQAQRRSHATQRVSTRAAVKLSEI